MKIFRDSRVYIILTAVLVLLVACSGGKQEAAAEDVSNYVFTVTLSPSVEAGKTEIKVEFVSGPAFTTGESLINHMRFDLLSGPETVLQSVTFGTNATSASETVDVAYDAVAGLAAYSGSYQCQVYQVQFQPGVYTVKFAAPR